MLPAILREKGVDHLHYMAHLENAASIITLGILSYNRIKEFPHRDVSMKKIQWIRKNTKLPNGKSVQDYVPLYFGLFTPMQYVLTYGSKNYREPIGNNNLVFFEVDAEKIFSIEGIYFTDGNAASFYSQIYDDFDELDKLDWHIILNVKKCLSSDYKRKKAAEVLVPEWVPPICFKRVVVWSTAARNFLIKQINKMKPILKKHGLDQFIENVKNIPIEFDHSHYM